MFAEVPLIESEFTSHVEIYSEDNFHCLVNEPEIMECFLALSDNESYQNLPFKNVTENPLNLKHMRDKQYADNDILRLKEKYPECYFTKEMGNVKDLIC